MCPLMGLPGSVVSRLINAVAGVQRIEIRRHRLQRMWTWCIYAYSTIHSAAVCSSLRVHGPCARGHALLVAVKHQQLVYQERI